MDIASAVEQIYPDADFRRSDTYENLRKTWKDKRILPTEAQLAVAWVEVLDQRSAQSVQDIAHADRVEALHDDLLLAELTYEQRVDLITNVLRVEIPQQG